MGADSAFSHEENERLDIARTPKISKRNGWVFGVAGDSGACSAITSRARPPKLALDAALDHIVRVELPDELRSVLASVGLTDSDWSALFATRGQIWYTDSNWDAYRVTLPHNAVGCGSMAALGALDAMPWSTPPERKLRLALQIAERRYNGVRRPFRFLSTK